MSKKLLLADDSITIQKVIGITFVNKDYDLTVVDNGDAAFEKARLDRPDLILADVFMPGKNGYELCAAVKQDPALAGVPVLLLTGTFEPFDEDKARAVGADGWIPKPFESQTLVDRVEELLTKAAEGSALTEPVETLAPAEPAAAAVAPPASAVESALLEEPDADLWGDFEVEEPEPLLSTDEPLSAPTPPVQPHAEAPSVPEAEDDLAVEDIWGDVSFDDEVLSDEAEGAGSSEGESPMAAVQTVVEEPVFTDIQDVAEVKAETSPPADVADAEDDELVGFDEVDLGETFEAEEGSDAEDLGESFVFADEAESDPMSGAFESEDEFDADEVSDAFEMEDELDTDGVSEAFEIENKLDEDETSGVFDDEDNLIEGETPEVIADEDNLGLAGLDFEPELDESADEEMIVDLSEDDEILALDEDDILEELDEEEQDSFAAVAEAPVPDEKPRLAVVPPPGLKSEPEVPAEVVQPLAPAASVETRVAALSESDLEAIVEKVAGTVIERLAKTVLEKVAWEVVPDLAEALIKDEINKIRESVR